MGAIHLIRHGPSAHVDERRWYSCDDVHLHESAYDAAGIRDDLPPPAAIVTLAREADVLLASDMRRAIDSARVLAPDRTPAILPELRELSLDPPRWIPVPLPISAWGTMSFVSWSARLAVRSAHPVMRQAAQASDSLLDAAASSDSVVAVTHGAIRRVIAAELLRRGRHLATRDGGYENWSCWTLR